MHGSKPVCCFLSGSGKTATFPGARAMCSLTQSGSTGPPPAKAGFITQPPPNASFLHLSPLLVVCNLPATSLRAEFFIANLIALPTAPPKPIPATSFMTSLTAFSSFALAYDPCGNGSAAGFLTPKPNILGGKLEVGVHFGGHNPGIGMHGGAPFPPGLAPPFNATVANSFSVAKSLGVG